MSVSIIIPVLDSHEIVHRQIKRFSKIITDDIRNWVEVIFVDDGSTPPLVKYLEAVGICFVKDPDTFDGHDVFKYDLFTIIETKDYRAWTQGLACNIGVSYSKNEYIVGYAIDHFFDIDSIKEAISFEGTYLKFKRKLAYINEDGDLEIGREIRASKDIYCMKREVFLAVGGYNKKLIGRYGGIDADFFSRYYRKYTPPIISKSYVYAYPDCITDKHLFHSLKRR